MYNISMSKLFKYWYIFPLSFLALTDYYIAKSFQISFLHFFPAFSYVMALSLPWIAISALPLLFLRQYSGMRFQIASLTKNWRYVVFLMSVVTFGLVIFVNLHLTQYFHHVKYPIIFFLITPVAEELLFRGAVYEALRKMNIYPIVGSALLFGLHHLQYFDFHLTRFAVFQMTYTFFLGLLFGLMRKKSSSIYPSLVTHILINWVTVYF